MIVPKHLRSSAFGIVGFGHLQGSWFWTMYVVRGKRCLNVPLVYPLYLIIYYMWKRYENSSMHKRRS